MNKRYVFILLIVSFVFKMNTNAQTISSFGDEFYYGFSVYPEFMDRKAQVIMLDSLQKAGINFLRVAESSWGNIETDSGVYEFDWLHFFLDEMHKRGMKAMLGTGSYIPPQWLTAKYPEILCVFQNGTQSHPMGRRAICRNHPIYVEAVLSYVRAIGNEFKNHPAVTSWQIDNETDAEFFNYQNTDYNPMNQIAWTNWLRNRFGSVQRLNDDLHLVEWGLKVTNFEDIPIPRLTNDGYLNHLWMLFQRFTMDTMLALYESQKKALREVGANQYITSDWTITYASPCDVPLTTEILDISGLNFYQPTNDNVDWWNNLAFQFDLHRSANGTNRFLSLETRMGVAGGVTAFDNVGTREQFKMWMLQPAAFGSSMLLHWTSNRYLSGHWPQWGGVMDWSGHFEPDFEWVKEIASIYKKWGKKMLDNPVFSQAVVLSDFDSRHILKCFPLVPDLKNEKILPDVVSSLHRYGVGVDILTPERFMKSKETNKYKIAILTTTVIENPGIVDALHTFVSEGGYLIILPMVEYQTKNGIYLTEGFNKSISQLSETLVRTIRFNGREKDMSNQLVVWEDGTNAKFTVGLNGFFEILEPQERRSVIASFKTPESDILNGKPAITLKEIGKGKIFKLGFFPEEDFTMLLKKMMPQISTRKYFTDVLDKNIQAVPRSDGSVFIVNTSGATLRLPLRIAVKDRLSNATVNVETPIKPYQVLWIE